MHPEAKAASATATVTWTGWVGIDELSAHLEPINHGRIDQSRGSFHSSAHGVANRRKAQHDVEVLAHVRNKSLPADISVWHQSERLDLGRHCSNDFVDLIR